MVIKLMKRCLMSLVIFKMQINITVKYHFTSSGMTGENMNDNKCWQKCREIGTLMHWWCALKNVTAFSGNS